MEKVAKSFRMEISMKENIQMGSRMEEANTNGVMGDGMKGTLAKG